MDNKLYYFLIPFGLVLIIADAVLFYQIIGMLSVYLSVLLILFVLIGYFFYLGVNPSNSMVKLKRQHVINIKPVDNKKVLFYKKILIGEIVLIILLVVRILLVIM